MSQLTPCTWGIRMFTIGKCFVKQVLYCWESNTGEGVIGPSGDRQLCMGSDHWIAFNFVCLYQI